MDGIAYDSTGLWIMIYNNQETGGRFKLTEHHNSGDIKPVQIFDNGSFNILGDPIEPVYDQVRIFVLFTPSWQVDSYSALYDPQSGLFFMTERMRSVGDGTNSASIFTAAVNGEEVMLQPLHFDIHGFLILGGITDELSSVIRFN